MTPPLRFLSALLAAAVLALLTIAGAGPALAVRGVGHHLGVLWAADHTSWIGSYQLDDGNVGYCIDVTRPQPIGSGFEYVDGSTVGVFSQADSARLAFISGHFGSPSDPLTAAAAQLATWTIGGLGGHDQAYYARRANEAAGDVLAAANRILGLADAPGGASTGVRAQASLALEADSGTARSELVVDYLAGTATVPTGSFTGTMTLHGATFEGGALSRAVMNGEQVRILPDQHGAMTSVVVDVSFTRLPFGPGFRYARNDGSGQNLLVGAPYTAEADARAEASGPNALPFRPRVATTTSEVVASEGAVLTDTLRLDTHPESPTAPEWGVFVDADGVTRPIPVVVTSILHGPYPAPPQPADTAPAKTTDEPAASAAESTETGSVPSTPGSEGAPSSDSQRLPDAAPDTASDAAPDVGTAPMVAGVVCAVETRVVTGPGTYESPPCTLPGPGFYVWTDFIDPGRTPPDHGGDRLQPWQSRFGEAAETTLVPAAPTIVTEASHPTLVGAGCVSDHLTVAGLPAGIDPLPVRSTLLGPLPTLPEPETVPPGWQDFPVAGRVTTSITADGTYESPCIRITAPGHYYFTISSDAAIPFLSAPTSPKPVLIPAIVDLRVHTAEAVHLTAPPAPPVSPSPPATAPPAPGPSTAPPVARLAQTGGPSSTAMPIALAVSTVVLSLAGAGLLAGRRR